MPRRRNVAEEEDEGRKDFVDTGAGIPDEDDRGLHRGPFLPHEKQQETRTEERCAKSLDVEHGEGKEATDVEQQALLPSAGDPKLWKVKCWIHSERQVVVYLMQKFIVWGPELQIRSVIALDHLKNFIYIEADEEAHVRDAIKITRYIYASAELMLVPMKEMTDVLSVKSKAIDISRDTWVRLKFGAYTGDLAKVVHVDNVKMRAIVKVIPRVDLQALADNLEGKEVPKKRAFIVPPARLMNIDEARELHIRVERRQDPTLGDYFEQIDGMKFKDGFLYKNVPIKMLNTHIL